jgi:hypothetical protein
MSGFLKWWKKPSKTNRSRGFVTRLPARTHLDLEALEDLVIPSVSAHFNWSMAPRFGADQGTLGPDGTSAASSVLDGRMDIHNDPSYVQNYDPVTHFRLGYNVSFDASPSTWTNSPISSYSWVVLGAVAAGTPGSAPVPQIVLGGE